VNHTLRRALADARLDEIKVSEALGVDPKTVQRWVAGRVPQRQHRWGLADLVVYAGLFLAEDVDVLRLLADKARGGVAVRVLLGDPDCPGVAERGVEEGIGDAIPAKIRNAIVLYRPLLRTPGIGIRLHTTVLYNSIYRADDELLVNVHVYGTAAAHAPVLNLRQATPGDLVTTYLESFDRVWHGATPLDAPE